MSLARLGARAARVLSRGESASPRAWRLGAGAALSAWAIGLVAPALGVLAGAAGGLLATRLAANRLRDAGAASGWAFAPAIAWIGLGALAFAVNLANPRHPIAPAGLALVDVATAAVAVLTLGWAVALACLPSKARSGANGPEAGGT